MSVTKKRTSNTTSRSSKKTGQEPGVTIVYKSKVSKSSFPQKTEKANKLLSKTKFLR